MYFITFSFTAGKWYSMDEFLEKSMNTHQKVNMKEVEHCIAIEYITADMVECLVINPTCVFSKLFGRGIICNHPLRKEIAVRTRELSRN